MNSRNASARRIAVHLHPGAERAVKAGHPWVYAEGIRQQRHEGRAGDLAVAFDRSNRFLAIGLYDPESPIRVRVLHQGDPATIDGAWFARRIAEAAALRAPLLASQTTGYRVVHGENDGLPGMVIDRYGENVVIKLYSAAWFPWLGAVVDALSAERVVLRFSRAVARSSMAGDLRDGTVLRGTPLDGPVMFQENGLWFEADLIKGQKTGFFLDQRENRERVEAYAAGRSVLNVFAYTGGFSLYAARGGAHTVASLDVCAPALAAAERNFAHNRHIPAVAATDHRLFTGDAYDLLGKLALTGELFDMVIIDPPSFAKAQAEVERAAVSYTRIIRLGLDVLKPGGMLVAASCSSRITAERFRELVEVAALRAGRTLRVLQQTGHALDHPIGFPEGAYLKCVFASAAG